MLIPISDLEIRPLVALYMLLRDSDKYSKAGSRLSGHSINQEEEFWRTQGLLALNTFFTSVHIDITEFTGELTRTRGLDWYRPDTLGHYSSLYTFEPLSFREVRKLVSSNLQFK